MHLCLFEDSRSAYFTPLTFLRPVYGLRCGLFTLAERTVSFFPRSIVSFHVRPALADLLREEFPERPVNQTDFSQDTLFVNGRAILTARAAAVMKKARTDRVFTKGDKPVAAFVSASSMRRMSDEFGLDALELSSLADLPHEEIDVRLVEYPWDLIYANEWVIEEDFGRLTSRGTARRGELHRTTVLLRPKHVHIGKNASIGPQVVLDASRGPIVIGENVTILPQTYIEGPCVIGPGSSVKAGSQILGGTSIGPVCRVGGEVSHSILQGFANKQHHGYLGHAYLSSWVNLGAGTTNSNLKNTYGPIRVRINGDNIDSGKMFLGLLAGDHVKTGINATIDTGTVIGVSSNVFGASLPPKYVPSFSWGSAGVLETYGIDKALAVAATVMQRRGIVLTPAYAHAFKHVFSATAHERSSHR